MPFSYTAVNTSPIVHLTGWPSKAEYSIDWSRTESARSHLRSGALCARCARRPRSNFFFFFFFFFFKKKKKKKKKKKIRW